MEKQGKGGQSNSAELAPFCPGDVSGCRAGKCGENAPIKDIEIKCLLKDALTDEINRRELYMKGIDYSYYYEGYAAYKAEEIK